MLNKVSFPPEVSVTFLTLIDCNFLGYLNFGKIGLSIAFFIKLLFELCKAFFVPFEVTFKLFAFYSFFADNTSIFFHIIALKE